MHTMPSERLIEHGLKLLATAEVAAPAASEHAREALARWRALSPAHEAATQEAARRWQMLGGLADDLKARFDEPALTADAGTVRRRQALRLLVGVGGTVALGSGTAWYWRQPLFEQTLHTGIGEQRTASLPDGATDRPGPGSRLDLNARTDLTVRLYRHRRVVTLAQGEARFDVAPDARRPFTVETRAGTLTVLGTAFTVNDRGGPVSIHVEHGRVRWIAARAAGQPAIDLTAGQSLVLRHGQPGPVMRTPAGQADAWREGWLVFDNVRLDEALPQINAHRPQALVLGDARVRAMPLTGRFRAAESDRLVAVLPAILPLRTVPLPDGRIELQALTRRP